MTLSPTCLKRLATAITLMTGHLCYTMPLASAQVELLDGFGGERGFGENQIVLDRADKSTLVPVDDFTGIFVNRIDFYGQNHQQILLIENDSLRLTNVLGGLF